MAVWRPRHLRGTAYSPRLSLLQRDTKRLRSHSQPRTVQGRRKRRFLFYAKGTLLNLSCWPFSGESKSGERRRKPTPNVRLCRPFWTVRLRTTLICRCRKCWFFPCPIKLYCPNDLIRKKKFAFCSVNGLGSGREDNGTAPPKSSTS